jgi:arylsulfatase A
MTMMKSTAIILLLTVLAGMTHAAPARSPNFVFFLIDDQSWSGSPVAMLPGKDFSRTSTVRMPNVERLATHGLIFSQAYASHPKCECSRASIQMGCSTTTLNATDKWARNWNKPAGDSLVNTLKRAKPDYRAAHLGKWQWSQTPESFGYDVSDGVTMNQDGESDDPNDPKQSFGITRRAQTFMEEQVKQGHPFYLQLAYYAIHGPAQALASTLKKYEGVGGGGGKGNKGGGGRGNREAVMAAMTEDLDTCIGQVLKKLEDLGIAENTYIIYMSDNGGPTEVLRGGKGDLGEGGLRVPLIVCGPSVAGGKYCDAPAVGYDILPTVLDLAAPGFALTKGVEGGSWKQVLQSGGAGKIERPIDRLVFYEAVEIEHPQAAIRKGDYKLLYYWDTKESFLYNLANDLSEKQNLAKQQPEVAAALLKELKDHVRAGFGEQAFTDLDNGKIPQNTRPGGGQGGKGKGGKQGGKGGEKGKGGQGKGDGRGDGQGGDRNRRGDQPQQ